MSESDSVDNPGEASEEEEPAALDRVFSLFEEIYETIVQDIIDRTKVVEVKRYGGHEITRFKDGRVVCLSRRRWAGDQEEPLPPTPYELIQLGEDPGRLYAVELTLWQKAAAIGLPAIVGGLSLFGWAGSRLRKRRR